ncbi:MAG: RdgB/HAM1 family non-canonical purine NTP pyrophosphatase [Synechococcus sp. MED-G71]|nr:MAG: RdgB/HAM1 family non-canonical purine NTP pyrophosphatase [Synechococcus sp. MED-G71]
MSSTDVCPRILVIASGNAGKVREFRNLLAHLPLQLQSQPEGLQVDETGTTFAANARLKALAVARCSGQWALADDSGLSVTALGGAPGVHSARYAASDPERIARLLRELGDADDRSAQFCAALCVAAPDGEVLLEVEGRCNGWITTAPRGDGGFGYDPVFEVGDTSVTFAEMTLEQKRLEGHRGRAFALLEPQLQKLLLL